MTLATQLLDALARWTWTLVRIGFRKIENGQPVIAKRIHHLADLALFYVPVRSHYH